MEKEALHREYEQNCRERDRLAERLAEVSRVIEADAGLEDLSHSSGLSSDQPFASKEPAHRKSKFLDGELRRRVERDVLAGIGNLDAARRGADVENAVCATLRSWVSPQLADIEESRRQWRLRCVQAEAELRALQAGVGPAIPGAATLNEPGSLTDMFEDGCAALENVLSLERHISEYDSWFEHARHEASLLNARAEVLECQAKSESIRVDGVRENTSVVCSESAHYRSRREHSRHEYDQVCWAMKVDAKHLKSEASGSKQVLQEHDRVGRKAQELRLAVQRAEAEELAHFKVCERLRVRRAEVRKSRTEQINKRASHQSDIHATRSQGHSRHGVISRLTADLSRNKGKSDRKLRPLQGQLSQCRAELADAVQRADLAGEQLRKVKQQQGKQLRHLRGQSVGLQAEVDERLRSTETTEDRMQELHEEERRLEEDSHLHVGRQEHLEKDSEMCLIELDCLRQALAEKEVGHDSLREHVLDIDERYHEIVRSKLKMAEFLNILQQRMAEEVVASGALRPEVEQAERQWSLKGGDHHTLMQLEAQVCKLNADNAALVTDLAMVQEGARQSRIEQEKHVCELREAGRRCRNLKSHHAEMMQGLSRSAQGRENIVGLDQSMNRVMKKVDNLLACVESTPAKKDRVNDRGVAALNRRLQTERERTAEMLVNEERHQVTVEHEENLEMAKEHADDCAEMRTEIRNLENELMQNLEACDWVRRDSEKCNEKLREEVRLVENEVADSAEVATAEFSDLLHKQTLERDVLKKQIDEFRDASRSLEAPRDEDEDDQPIEGSGVVGMWRLEKRNAEISMLESEEQELREGLVMLKAARIADPSLPRLQDTSAAAAELWARRTRSASPGRPGEPGSGACQVGHRRLVSRDLALCNGREEVESAPTTPWTAIEADDLDTALAGDPPTSAAEIPSSRGSRTPEDREVNSPMTRSGRSGGGEVGGEVPPMLLQQVHSSPASVTTSPRNSVRNIQHNLLGSARSVLSTGSMSTAQSGTSLVGALPASTWSAGMSHAPQVNASYCCSPTRLDFSIKAREPRIRGSKRSLGRVLSTGTSP